MTPRDPFDYKLRPKEEVAEEFRNFPPEFNIIVNYKRYNAGDMSQHKKTMDNRERVAKLRVDIRTLRLAPLQRKRFQFLLGPRWNP